MDGQYHISIPNWLLIVLYSFKFISLHGILVHVSLNHLIHFGHKCLIPCSLNFTDCHERASREKDTLYHPSLLAWWKVITVLDSFFVSFGKGWEGMLRLKLNFPSCHVFSVFAKLCSYEDWGVDELIVEDSWKRQVGGDWWLKLELTRVVWRLNTLIINLTCSVALMLDVYVSLMLILWCLYTIITSDYRVVLIFRCLCLIDAYTLL